MTTSNNRAVEPYVDMCDTCGDLYELPEGKLWKDCSKCRPRVNAAFAQYRAMFDAISPVAAKYLVKMYQVAEDQDGIVGEHVEWNFIKAFECLGHNLLDIKLKSLLDELRSRDRKRQKETSRYQPPEFSPLEVKRRRAAHSHDE